MDAGCVKLIFGVKMHVGPEREMMDVGCENWGFFFVNEMLRMRELVKFFANFI